LTLKIYLDTIPPIKGLAMQKILEKLIAFSLITVTMTYASNENNVNTLENNYNTAATESYQHMTTAQLQEEVEKRSINGDLSFEMGLELLKRWSNS
jgi:hypothetical protein